MKKTILALSMTTCISAPAIAFDVDNATETTTISKYDRLANQVSVQGEKIEDLTSSVTLATLAVDHAIKSTQDNKTAINANASAINENTKKISANATANAMTSQTADYAKKRTFENEKRLAGHQLRIDALEDNDVAQENKIKDVQNKVQATSTIAKDAVITSTVNSTRLDSHEKLLEKHHEELYGNLDGFQKEIEQTGKEITSTTNKVNELSRELKNNDAKLEQAQVKAAIYSKQVDTNKESIAANSKRINENSKRIDQNTKDIYNLRQDFEKMSEEMSAGIAGVAAMANMPPVRGIGNLGVSVGTGYFNGEAAIAVGVGYRHSENLSAQFGVSANSGNNVKPVVGAGMTYEF